MIVVLLLASACLAQISEEAKSVKNPSSATQASKVKSTIVDKFVGSWKLVAMEGPQFPKRDRVGVIMYDNSGQMSVHIMTRDRPRFASNARQQGSQEEVKAAFD